MTSLTLGINRRLEIATTGGQPSAILVFTMVACSGFNSTDSSLSSSSWPMPGGQAYFPCQFFISILALGYFAKRARNSDERSHSRGHGVSLS